MDIPYDSKSLWCQQIERRLYELSSLIKGQIPTQADRVSDLVEQIDQIRKDLEAIGTKVERMAECLRPIVKEHKTNGKVV